ncbi:hypothetical protein Landi51_02951 [Colletotrichum acutatum]
MHTRPRPLHVALASTEMHPVTPPEEYTIGSRRTEWLVRKTLPVPDSGAPRRGRIRGSGPARHLSRPTSRKRSLSAGPAFPAASCTIQDLLKDTAHDGIAAILARLP